jgi:hypothetical protein
LGKSLGSFDELVTASKIEKCYDVKSNSGVKYTLAILSPVAPNFKVPQFLPADGEQNDYQNDSNYFQNHPVLYPVFANVVIQ